MLRSVLFITFLLTLAACSGERTVREIGIIEPSESIEEEILSSPDIAQAGVPFDVTVRTVGTACVEADGLEKSIERSLAVLVPYDLYITPGRGVDCPLVPEAEPRTTQLTFNEPGSAIIRVEGRSQDDLVTGGSSRPAVVEKTITVE